MYPPQWIFPGLIRNTRKLSENLPQIFWPFERQEHTIHASTLSDRVWTLSAIDTPISKTQIISTRITACARCGTILWTHFLHLYQMSTFEIAIRKQSKLETWNFNPGLFCKASKGFSGWMFSTHLFNKHSEFCFGSFLSNNDFACLNVLLTFQMSIVNEYSFQSVILTCHFDTGSNGLAECLIK